MRSQVAEIIRQPAGASVEFLVQSLASSASVADLLLGEGQCEQFVRLLGVKMAGEILAGGVGDGHYRKLSFSQLLDRLKDRLGLRFTIAGEKSGCVALRVDLGPMAGAQITSSLVRLLTAVFGGLALLHSGYGKVVLGGIPGGSEQTVDVTVIHRRNTPGQAADGLEFTSDLTADVTSAPPASVELLTSRVNELAAFDEINRKISSSIDLPTVLGDVISAARRLLRADLGWIALRDRETGELIAERWDGLGGDDNSTLGPVKVAECLCGEVLAQGGPVVSYDLIGDPRISSQSLRELIDREQMKTSLLVPLRAQDRLVGVLGVHRRVTGEFGQTDVSLLSTLANQAAVAIENARLYEHERATVATLQALNAELSAQREQLKRSAAIHDQLTGLALAGHGIDALSQTLANLVANPVVVENQFFQQISQASPPGSPPAGPETAICTPRSLIEQASFQRLMWVVAQERRPVRIGPQDSTTGSRVLAPIIVESEVLGYVSVIEQSRPLADLDLVAIEHAATIIALEMMRRKTALEVEMRLKGDFLDDLLSADAGAECAIVSRAAYLGYNLNEPHRFAIVDVDDFAAVIGKDGHDERWALSIKRRLFDVVNAVVPRLSPRSLVVAKSDTVFTMINVQDAKCGVPELLEQLRQRIAEAMPEITVSIGVGRESESIGDFKKSCEEARRALLIIKNANGRGRTAWFERLGLYSLLFQVSDKEELARFAERVLGRLLDYDRRHHTQLVATLEGFLQNGHNLQRAAQALNIHVNTLGYRLQRIREIGQLDLDQPNERLDAEVALLILRATPR